MELDLKKIVSLFMSKIWFIISAAIVGGIVFFVINTYFVVPKNTSSALLYVSNMSERKSSVVTTSDVAVSKELVDTCPNRAQKEPEKRDPENSILKLFERR